MSERIAPWFGDYPPEFKGDIAEMKKNDWREKWTIPILVILLTVGLVLMILPNIFGMPREWVFIPTNIGIALFVAGILGLTIDRLLRQQLAQDAFKASVGYLLPDELKPEMEWVYKQDVIATKHIQKCVITPMENNLVICQVTINRTLTNVSHHPAEVKPALGIDEWFHHERHSDIIEFGWEMSKGIRYNNENFELEKRDYSLHIKERDEDKISLGPKATINIWFKYEEIRHINDEHSITFIYPTNNPFVEVEAFEGMGISVGLTMHKQQSLSRVGHNRYELNGTLLPGQKITIRWWSIEDSKKWLGEDPQRVND